MNLLCELRKIPVSLGLGVCTYTYISQNGVQSRETLKKGTCVQAQLGTG